MDAIYDYPVCFTMLTNNLYSNPSPHMLVPLLLVPLNIQDKYQERDRKRVQTEAKKIQAQRKT